MKHKKKGNNKSIEKQKSRQELRKIQRKEKKQKKHLYFQRIKKSNETDNTKLLKTLSKVNVNKDNTNNTNNNIQIRNEKSNNLKMQEDKLKKEMDLERIKQMKMANKNEDKLIKKLEKELKLKKRKSTSIPKSFSADGLDYILEICENPQSITADDGNFEDSGSDLEEDMDILTNKKRKKVEPLFQQKSSKNKLISEDESENLEPGSDESLKEDYNDELNDEENEEDLDNEDVEEFESDDEKSFNEDIEFDNDNDDDFDKNNTEESENDDNDKETDEMIENSNSDNHKENKFWEDIYGRVRDSKGNVVTQKYIPPQKREITNNEQLKRIERQMKGLLNRLAESNIKGISSQIEDIYQSNSRHSTNQTLIKLIFDAIVSPTLTPERLIMEYSMLISILHAHIGSEIGAHILQELIKHFHSDYMKYTNSELETKELVNLILLISYLYNFNLFNSVLIYDILKLLANNFQEKDIELILNILKSAGFSLRKDDPGALKQLILSLQTKANQIQEQDSSRCQFMLNVLLAIKNNNMAKIPNYDPTHFEYLKKLLKSILRKGTFISEIKISLEDLLKADERGRWWIVGSAWVGPSETDASKTNNPLKPSNNEYSQKLLQLAKQQRMNTDTRRNIFCILMSAQDYTQAYEKLLQLGLKNQQEREIIYVLVHCCLQEKKFNPYYAYVAQQLCLFERRFQLTFQYTLWDRLRELNQLNDTKISNLALLTKQLIMERALPLTALKVIEFAKIEKPLVRFLRQLLLGLLLDKNEENCKSIFEKVSLVPNLKHFRDGLRLFLQQFLMRKLENIENKELLENRINLVDKMISLVDQHKGTF